MMDRIRETQKTDKEIASIKEKLTKERLKDFVRMSTTPYCLRFNSFCVKIYFKLL